ncbi:peptidoglycan-binding protein [Spongiactinospora sp. 9N601]|uniref:peptidoglycan-binding protein n=1 Tax=Spongiactinospora sp. 9N601 TaxID=3375149 RepID=UPI0037A831E3
MTVKSPRRLLAGIVGGVVLIAGAGWIVGGSLRSPADEAALREPPRPSLVTAPVRRQKLTSAVALNGTLEYGSPLTITLAGAVGPATEGAAPQRVTRAPRPGRIVAGRPLMEVNGRPVFALAGKVPMHRTIAPGTRGADVRQLQRALRRLRFGAPRSGVFDAGTAAAVQRWYRARGYRAQEPGLDARQALGELRAAVQTAEETLAADRAALRKAEDVGSLRKRLANARADLRAARKAGDGKAIRTAEEAVLAAEEALRDARRTGPLRLKITNGRDKLARARANLLEYQAAYGISIPPGEIVFLPELPARLTKTALRAGEPVAATVGTVTGTAMVINGSVDDQEAGLLREGLPAVIETGAGKTHPARLTAMGADARVPTEKSDEQADPGSVPVRITPAGTAKLREQAGAAVTVRITVGETEGEVLTVPVAAVITAADGRPRVQVEYATDRTRAVEVRTGLTADGRVQVSGAIKEGDRVVIGNG